MTMLDTAQRFARANQTLEAIGQLHLLSHYDQLSEEDRDLLLDQIESIDWKQVNQLIDSHVKTNPEFHLPDQIEPAPYYPKEPADELASHYDQARELGEALIHQGKVAAFCVAGGQGTRLGWDGPKGTYAATPITGKCLFAVFAEYILKTQKKYHAIVPWYIMTSSLNNQATMDAFEENNYYGLDKQNVKFFVQGVMPSIGYDGKVLLAEPGKIALNPDGHGGSLRALYHHALEDMEERGIEQLSYFQVDNTNVRCIDPLFIGLHALAKAQMSSKMIRKTGPTERVGNFCLVDGKVTVIEYSDLPDEIANQVDENGELRIIAGSIAIHMIAVEFIKQVNEGGNFSLPFHRADKKVNYYDLDIEKIVTPDEPNAVKLETFVFDAIPLCQTSVVYQTDRVEEFAPIKNGTGVDSAESSKLLQTERAARWLEANGMNVPRKDDGSVDAVIELSHLTAIEPDDLKSVDLPDVIEAGSDVLL